MWAIIEKFRIFFISVTQYNQLPIGRSTLLIACDGRRSAAAELDFSRGLEYLWYAESKETTLEEVPMFLFGPVGPTELILIILIVVIIFGARRLPELGKSLGEGIKNFKKSVTSKEKDNESRDESEPPSKEK
jgi:sec-independent protein translocase protein TatA